MNEIGYAVQIIVVSGIILYGIYLGIVCRNGAKKNNRKKWY
jgi:hypothetical protein